MAGVGGGRDSITLILVSDTIENLSKNYVGDFACSSKYRSGPSSHFEATWKVHLLGKLTVLPRPNFTTESVIVQEILSFLVNAFIKVTDL